MNTNGAVKITRQVLAVVMSPKLRQLLNEGEVGNAAQSQAPRFEWLQSPGNIDTEKLKKTLKAMDKLLGEEALLEFGRVVHLPTSENDRRQLSLRIVEEVFSRFGKTKTLSEERLNAALLMLVEDFAVVRRDAVDAGYLNRTPDGRTYTWRPAGPQEDPRDPD